MRICPNCGSTFDDDSIFCLYDGNTLNEDSREFETIGSNLGVFVGSERVSFTGPEGECSRCGMLNRGGSKFCRGCGHALGLVAGTVFAPVGSDPHFSRTTSGISSPLPPTLAPPTNPHNKSESNRHLIVVGSLIGLLFLITLVLWRGSEKSGNSSAVANKAAADAMNAAANAMQSAANEAQREVNGSRETQQTRHPDVGRIGVLTTNQRIRSAPNRYSEILGVHYYGARVRVLEVNEYTTNEGMATWYRVYVIQNGCDREGYMGCGNDLDGESGAAATSGWMNAKYIRLE